MPYVVKFDHPYYGDMTLRGRTIDEILSEALKTDHPCEDTTGCDVANMVAGGFFRIAADRMLSGGEPLTVGAVVEKYPALFSRKRIERDENEWWETIKDLSVFCPECRTLLHGQDVYLDEIENLPTFCTNCAKGFDPEKAERPTRGR